MALSSKKKQKKIKSKKVSLVPVVFKKAEVIIGSLLILSLLFITMAYLFISSHQLFAANFADDILRPTIGNTSTIILESFFFKIEDGANKIIYSFVKVNPSLFTKSPQTKKEPISTSDTHFVLKKIVPLFSFPPILGEGEWAPINTGTQEAIMAKTFIRPDPERAYAIAYLVKMNMANLIINSVAGTREPGGHENPGAGKIPLDIQKENRLVAAFNGGFQKKDGYYGMIVGTKQYLPLQKDLATLVIYKNSWPKILKYTGQNLGKDVMAIRQNGPLLLENSKDVSGSKDWNMQTWGLTTTNSMYTWRSGIGITKNGNIIYAAGPNLVPHTLATALKAAGAVSAMQLDINPIWVRFVIFNGLGNGKYNYYSLTDNMINGGSQYLSGYQKDFFYLVKK